MATIQGVGITAAVKRVIPVAAQDTVGGAAALQAVEAFAAKAVDALDLGVHVLLIDLLPPSRHDPRGLHEVV